MNKKKLGTIHYFPIEFPHLEIPKMVEILEKFSNSTHNVKTERIISYRYQFVNRCRFRQSNLKKILPELEVHVSWLATLVFHGQHMHWNSIMLLLIGMLSLKYEYAHCLHAQCEFSL